MKLSTRSRYGVRILAELARHSDGGPVKVGKISEEQKITVKYLEQLIRPLKKAGLVKSIRGPKGGHTLAKRPKEITLGQVVRILEGKSDLLDCLPYPESCNFSDGCPARKAWKEASDALYEKLDAISIADLVQDDTVGVCPADPLDSKKQPEKEPESQILFRR
ncbi:MAG: Rrf2 family transcriptional regulator [Deltaproteobacteria bacterium]|nr:Rrf2 family transcriptional regulator [Deltaproteobacteria bacterium]